MGWEERKFYDVNVLGEKKVLPRGKKLSVEK